MKARKKPKPVRRGTAFWLVRGDQVLLVRRPGKGLLGGMRALPSGEWGDTEGGLGGAPADVVWRTAGRVDHVFTHFALELTVMVGTGEAEGEWWPIDRIDEAGLPTLFAKAVMCAQSLDP